jgi:hypothetical protein
MSNNFEGTIVDISIREVRLVRMKKRGPLKNRKCWVRFSEIIKI